MPYNPARLDARLADLQNQIDNISIAATVVQYLPSTATPAELQAALDAVETDGPVFVGPGTLALSTTDITVDGPYALRGSGEDITIFTYTGSGSGLVVNNGAGVETIRGYGGHFTLDGTNATTGGAYGITLGQNSVSPFTGSGFFECITVKRFSVAGVRLRYSALSNWLRCTFASNRDGVWLTNDYVNGVTTASFTGCRFITSVKRGLFVEQGDTVVFQGNCQFEDNGEEGALLKHPGGATAVMRNLTIRESYAEDNGAAGAFSDIRFDNASTQSIQNGAVLRTRFQGTNADGNLYFGKGSFLFEDNEFNPVATSNVILLSSTVCFAHGRDSKNPTTFMTAGANAPATYERRASDGTWMMYTNRSGTMTAALTVSAAGALTVGGTVTASAFISSTANVAAAGAARLARADTLNYRNNANGADNTLGCDTSDNLEWNSVDVTTLSNTQTLTNKKVRNLKDDERCYVRAKTAVAQSLTSGSDTRIDFDSEDLDSRSAFTTGASCNFTVPTGHAGVYLISATVGLAAGTAGLAQLAILKNGTTIATHRMDSTSDLVSLTTSTIASLADADEIKFHVYREGGGARTLYNNNTFNHVSIVRLVTDL